MKKVTIKFKNDKTFTFECKDITVDGTNITNIEEPNKEFGFCSNDIKEVTVEV